MENIPPLPKNLPSLSLAAAQRIKKLVHDQKNPKLMVRLEVLGGGCSGFRYKFGFDEQCNSEEDIIIDHDGAKLIVDRTSLDYLKGSEVDYGESLMEAGFRVVNPNAASSCGCGSSFSVKE